MLRESVASHFPLTSGQSIRQLTNQSRSGRCIKLGLLLFANIKRDTAVSSHVKASC
jgi:hypothetical protein